MIGLHDGGLLRAYASSGKLCDYEVIETSSLEDMKIALDKQNVNAIIMDINLGRPGAEYLRPSEIILKRIEPDFKKGLVKFIAISGDLETVNLAKSRGIPAENKGEFRIFPFLENP